MFTWFRRDPRKAMRKRYDQLLEQGMLAQRNGDMRSYAQKSAEAAALWERIAAMDKGR